MFRLTSTVNKKNTVVDNMKGSEMEPNDMKAMKISNLELCHYTTSKLSSLMVGGGTTLKPIAAYKSASVNLCSCFRNEIIIDQRSYIVIQQTTTYHLSGFSIRTSQKKVENTLGSGCGQN